MESEKPSGNDGEARSFTFEELNKLPPWAAAALAVRCAMRAEPLVSLDSIQDYDSKARAEIIPLIDLVITVSSLIGADALPADMGAVAYDVYVSDATHKGYATDAGFSAITHSYAAATCATDAAFATDAATYAAKAASAAMEACAVADADASADASARSDYSFLSRELTGSRMTVLSRLYSIPLWSGGEPSGWEERLARWRDELSSLASYNADLKSLPDRYMRLHKGGGFDWGEAESRVRAWLEQHGKADLLKRETDAVEGGEEVIEKKTEILGKPGRLERVGVAPATQDLPTTVDLLNREVLVNALAAMFAAKEQATPFTMALMGDWGAGKSSVIEQMQAALKREPITTPWQRFKAWKKGLSGDAQGETDAGQCAFRFAEFNAWEYEHTANIRAGLAHEVLKGLLDGLVFSERLWLKVRFAWREHRLSFTWGLVKALAVIFAGAVGYWWLSALGNLANMQSIAWLSGSAAALGAGYFLVYVYRDWKPFFEHPVATELLTYMKLPDYGEHLGLIPVMKKHIQALCELRGIKKGSNTRLLVIIDDLDRCNSDCIVETLDAARLVMDIPNTIVVVAIDDRIAFNAVADHYNRVSDQHRDQYAIARDYLGKIIQLSVKLPKPGDMSRFIGERLFAGVDKTETQTKRDRERFVTFREKLDQMIAPESALEDDAESGRTKVDAAPEPFASKQKQLVKEEQNKSEGPPPLLPLTSDDQLLFEKWARAFGFTNPRRLIRLSNTFRLLLQLKAFHNRDEDYLLAMLFWVEFLSSLASGERKSYESVLLSEADLTESKSNAVDTDIILKGLRSSLAEHEGEEIDKDQYERDKMYISLFTLPYRGDEPKSLSANYASFEDKS